MFKEIVLLKTYEIQQAIQFKCINVKVLSASAQLIMTTFNHHTVKLL